MLKAPRSASRSSPPMSGGCMLLFGLPFLLGGLAVGLFLYFPAMHDWWSARGWKEVPCWIENAEMKTSRGSKGGTTHKVEASYRYQYAGRTYHSEEVSFYGGSDNIGDFQQRTHAQIRAFAGKEQPFRCYVNPAQPEQAVLFRDLRWGLLLLMSVFPLVGGFVSFGLGAESRQTARDRKLQALHPGEPRRWRAEWSGETIQAAKHGLSAFLVVAGWIMLIQGPLALAIIVSGELMRAPLSALALLPCLLTWIPLSGAWQRLQTRRALGQPKLWLKQTPIRPGHMLEGELRLDRVLSLREAIQARLLCQRKITRRSGKNTSTVMELVWEHTQTLAAGEARRDMNGVALPLRVEIPRGLPCAVITDAAADTASNTQHEWSLELTPSNGGKPATLPLPVFVTAEEAKLAEAEPAHLAEVTTPSTAQLVERLKFRGVQAAFDAQGIPTLIDSPPGQSRGAAIFLIFFGAVWFAIFIVLVKQAAPWPFRLIWGLSSPCILGMGLWTLLYHRRVVITPDELRIITSLASLYSWQETYAPRHLIGFKHDTNLQSGNQSYYRVRAETTFGKQRTLVGGISESIIAEELGKRLEEWRKRG